MRRIILALIVSIFMAAGIVHAADEVLMTNNDVAQALVSMLNVELPAGAEELSVEEYFEVMANALAAAGVTNFVGLDPAANITYAEFIDLVYALLGGTEDIPGSEKLAYIAGIIPVDFSYEPGEYPTSSEITGFLNDPVFATAVAEAYSPPGFRGAGGQAPGFTLEDTPDRGGAGPATASLTTS